MNQPSAVYRLGKGSGELRYFERAYAAIMSKRASCYKRTVRIDRVMQMMLAALIFLYGGTAFAQLTGSDLPCTADRFGSSLNCTANEFGVASIFALAPTSISECEIGEQITLDLVSTINGSNSNRYDMALYTGQNGNDPQVFGTGELCSTSLGPTSSAGTFWTNFDGDVAGDYDSNAVTTPANTSPMLMEGVKLICAPDASGDLELPYLLSYSQSSSNNVTGPADVDLVPGTKSKCASGTGTAGGMLFYGYVDVVKTTIPAGDAQSFSFTASGDVIPSPTAFTLSDDGSTQRVRMEVTGTTRQLVITETAVNSWALTSINCTTVGGSGAVTTSVDLAARSVTVDLSTTAYGAICTFTNDFQIADLSINKTLVTSGPYTSGQTVTYELLVANAGPDTATNVVVNDTPSNISITSVSSSPSGECTAFPCTITNLAAGSSETITVTATIQ